MQTFIYMTNPAKIRTFLGQIQTAGVPPKLTLKVLESLGFKSVNDRPIIAVMKALSFVSTSGEPIDRWLRYRNKTQSGAVLAEGVREYYTDLFRTFPDAHNKDSEALRNYFSTHSKVASTTMDLIVRTFKTLCELSDFEASPQSQGSADAITIEEAPKGAPTAVFRAGSSGYTVNINIQLSLPSDATQEIFDAFFRSMRENLNLKQ